MVSDEAHLKAIGVMATNMDDMAPMLFCDLDGNMTAMVAPLTCAEEKEALAEFCKKLICDSRVTWLSLALESWKCSIPIEEQHREAEIMAMPPSERPGAQECIVVVISTAKEEKTYLGDILKVRGKRVMGKWELMPQTMQGRFTNLWKNAKAVTN